MSTATHPATTPPKTLDVEAVRADFPALTVDVRGKKLAYLDTAASAQKPNAVIDAEMECYRSSYANVHRGVHYLAEKATEGYEGARKKVQHFLNAAGANEIVFVRGTTEGVNLVASTWGRENIGEGDAILITEMEHHSNIVPWQMLCAQVGARLDVAPINDRGEVILEEFEKLITDRTKLVAFGHISNALGTINPVEKMIEMAHAKGAKVLIDGAQAAPHTKIDVQALDVDFYAISAHKMYGPSGIGALYAKIDLLNEMPPYQGGGEMITKVTFDQTEYNVPPHKFEAGTPNIAGAHGFGAAVDYVVGLGYEAIQAHEEDLLAYGTEKLSAMEGVRLIGTAENKASVLSFEIEGVHPHDIGTILDRDGIAVRVGHHCAQPVMDHFGVPATARASLAVYNTREEIDRLVEGIKGVQEMFA